MKNRLMTFLAFITTSFLLANSETICNGSAETFDQSLSQKLDAFMACHTDFSGVVLVAEKGKILFSKGYGFANAELKLPNTPQTKFRIASLTKPFTAVAIMHLQENGLLNVQDPISKYVPGYPNGDRITIHHLLTHTSGVPNYYKYFADVRYAINIEEMVSSFQKWPFEFEPGTHFCYSNSGYTILAHIIEKVSGKKYGQFLHDNIFKPLNMIKTSQNFSDNCAVGYIKCSNERQCADPIENPVTLIGNGDLYSSIEDLYRWGEALHKGEEVTQKSIKAIFYPHILMEDSTKRSHGYGWFIDERLNKRVVEYNGALRGFLSKHMRFMDEQVTVILLTNLENRDQFCQICDELVSVIFAP